MLGDLDLTPLLKYANTFYDYRNASVWSSPQTLKAFRKVEEPSADMDIYSFGMLLWELWHGHVPFDGDLKECFNYVVNEDSRPKIQHGYEGEVDRCDEEMAKLIRLCWQSETEQRPKFGYICKVLSQISAP